MGQGDASLTKPNQTPNTDEQSMAASLRVLRSWDERETAQTTSQGPQIVAKWERMWEGQDNQEVGLEAAILQRKRNSSLVQIRVLAPTMQRGQSHSPKLRVCYARGSGAFRKPAKGTRESSWRYRKSEC
eukprot:TRINITY_DN6530_c0_g1_i6.p3 TRINITY_DN6530_c0_g1~~TRINITY_DN6530_c0_g1_i6.p3  ORF type:complete len:129 (+),score=0.42 TRINITY_DN6530_c0_g1_i6:124-510(+)